ncbi:MAG: T9SS type A sorting domain-containing protein [Cyclobacteriaceae bacterium]
MKIFIAISIWMLLVAGSVTVATPKERSVGVITQKKENLFVLKASRKFKGAQVEVLSSSGYVVTSKKLNKRKLVIDFKNVSAGVYRIQVKKGSNKEEFQFIKK